MTGSHKPLSEYRHMLLDASEHLPRLLEDVARYIDYLSQPESNADRLGYRKAFGFEPVLPERRQPSSASASPQSQSESRPAKPDSSR